MSAPILIAIAAMVVYAAGAAYTSHRLRRVEKYFQQACGDNERIPFLVWLIGVTCWPTMLPTIVISTRNDPIP